MHVHHRIWNRLSLNIGKVLSNIQYIMYNTLNKDSAPTIIYINPSRAKIPSYISNIVSHHFSVHSLSLSPPLISMSSKESDVSDIERFCNE